MRILILLFITIGFSSKVSAQENVADIAHAMFKAIKKNDIGLIEKFSVNINQAYAILPKSAVGMSKKEQFTKYIYPMTRAFDKAFDDIQNQIKNKNINATRIDLQSYKMGKKDAAKVQAMSLFFKYNDKEHVLPISVVEIDERWYIISILDTSKMFD